MAQEFVIKSPDIEDKINQLLPSQGGFQAGVDFSASTMVVPIVDLTETAEGSQVRQDLQTAFDFVNTNLNFISNTTTQIIITTGYWRLFGTSTIVINTSAIENQIIISDGASNKNVFQHFSAAATATSQVTTVPFDFVVFLRAGDSVSAASSNSNSNISIAYRQIADINGNLITV